jgi:hypothetical protein
MDAMDEIGALAEMAKEAAARRLSRIARKARLNETERTDGSRAQRHGTRPPHCPTARPVKVTAPEPVRGPRCRPGLAPRSRINTLQTS